MITVYPYILGNGPACSKKRVMRYCLKIMLSGFQQRKSSFPLARKSRFDKFLRNKLNGHTIELYIIILDYIKSYGYNRGLGIEQNLNFDHQRVNKKALKIEVGNFTSRYHSLNKQNISGDFRFVVLEKYLAEENNLPFLERIIMTSYFFIKQFTTPEHKWFGLETANVKIEKVPLVIRPTKNIYLEREE